MAERSRQGVNSHMRSVIGLPIMKTTQDMWGGWLPLLKSLLRAELIGRSMASLLRATGL